MKKHNENKDRILFWEGGDGFECFSNFSIYPLMYDGKLWPTSEHAYQASKFDDQKIKDEIFNAESPLDAFNIGRDSKNILKKDWFQIRVKIMEDIIRQKIKQYPDIYKKLIETGKRDIIEASPVDSFWGWGPDKKGENNMGKIWMKLRSEILTKNKL